MNLIKTALDTFREEAFCECGGMMKHDNSIRGYEEPFVEYGHVCEKCGHKEYLKTIYPKLLYKSRGELHKF